MAQAARGNRADSVKTNHKCDTTTQTEGCSTDTFINGIGAVRLWDSAAVHNIERGEECVKHRVSLDTASSKVFINGRGAGRVGDRYGGSEEIVSGSNNVFFG